MIKPVQRIDAKADEHSTIDPHVVTQYTSAFFCAVAAALLLINLVPIFSIGFHQDDFRLLDHTQAWGWDLIRALQQDGYTLGFRPLNMLQHTILWNLIGENAALHQAIRIGVHLAFAGLLMYGTRLLGGSRVHAAVVILLYFASTVTRVTIYYWVMFTPADILCLSAVIVMLLGIQHGWSPVKLAVSALLIAAMAVYTKENGIAASGGILLLTLCFWNGLTLRHRAWLLVSQSILLVVYAASYRAFSANKWMTLSEFSLATAGGQAVEILKGVMISLGAPFSAIYLSLRHSGLPMWSTVVVVLLAACGVAWLVWMAHGQEVRQVWSALRARFGLGCVTVLLVVGFLLPYLPGRWFETRMLVSTFALGTLFWGILLGDALQAWRNTASATGMKSCTFGIAIVVMTAGLAAGTPFSPELRQQEQTAARLRVIVRDIQARGISNVCLVGFPTKGSLMRFSNARGVIGYESRRQLTVYGFSPMHEIPKTLACAVVRYDETITNHVPLRVCWPGENPQCS